MLAVHIAFLLASLIILTPLTSLIIQSLVKFSGEEALSDTDIAGFLLSPAGAVAGVVIASIMLTFALMGYAAMLVPAHAIQNDEQTSLIGTFKQLSICAPVLLRLSLKIVIRYLLTAIPFVAVIGLAYWFLLTDNDINYYLAEHPPEFLGAVAIAAVTLIALGVTLVKITINWFYSIPLVLFSKKTSKTAKALSTKATLGHRKTIALWLALWLFATPLLSFLLTAPVTGIANWMIPQLANRLPMLALVIGGSVLLNGIISFAFSFITISLLAHQNIRMFKEQGLDHTHAPTKDELSRAHHLFRISPKDKLVLLLGLLAVLAATGISYRMINQIEFKDSTLIIAHRGASKEAPENTLAAIKKAVELGADWVEIDVQETADGKVIVYHDSDFKRLGNNSLNTWNAQSSELSSIDIGSWFDPRFSKETPPSLEDVLQVCKGKSGVLIELKYYGHDQQLEQRVIDLVEKHQMQDHVKIMSLSYAGIQKFHKLRPTWPIGLLSTVALGDITKLNVNFLGLNSRAATKSLIQKAHSHGIDVFAWTIDDPIDISTMTSRGVDGLITNVPDVAQNILQQRKKLSTSERLMLELAHIFGKRAPIGEQ